MHLNCPHCQNPIELVEDTGNEVVCPSCGSSVLLDPGITKSYLGSTAPRRLGRFEFLEKLGVGGFGIVFKARDVELDRIVALKIPRSTNVTSQDDVDRFFREARAAAQLNHANIVSVFDAAQIDGTCLLVSEYVDGTTLSDRLSAGRLSFSDTVDLLISVAEALHYAHLQGVIHRDLKPSNILLDSNGQPHVADFGLAKREAGEITMTIEGQVLGTPAYMSPEQARGEAHEVDRRSDVYSLGVMLYEMLTGELPFRGNKRMLILQVLHDEPRLPRTLNDRIPSDLETICLKAMSKSVAGRYATAQELADDLGRWKRGEPIYARPISRRARAWRWMCRNPEIASLAAAVFVTLFTGTLISTYFAVQSSTRARQLLAETNRANEKARDSDEKANIARKQRDRADAADKVSRRHLYAAHMSLAQSAWENARVGRLLQLLELYGPGSPYEELRGFEWYYWDRLCHRELRTLNGHSGGVTSVAFHPDGLQMVSASKDKTLKTWIAFKGGIRSRKEILTMSGHTGVVESVTYSPDGKRIASSSADKTIKIWDAVSGQEQLTLTGHSGTVTSVAYNHDGTRLASTSKDETVKLWDATTGKDLMTFRGHKYPVYAAVFSPDGTKVASSGGDRTMRVWDTASGKEILTIGEKRDYAPGYGGGSSLAYSPDGKRIAWLINNVHAVQISDAMTGEDILQFDAHKHWIDEIRYSPDGEWILSTSHDQTVKLWNANTGQESMTLKGHTKPVTTAVFSPNGKAIASGSDDGTVKLWDANVRPDNMTMRRKVLKKEYGNWVNRISFSPDGRRIVAVNYEVRIWDLVTGQVTQLSKGRNGVEFSPDGTHVAAIDDPNVIRIFDATTGQERLTLQGHSKNIVALAYSRDGKRIASAGNDQMVKLWNPADGQETETLRWDTKRISSVALNSDSTRLIASSDDRMIKVWDLALAREIMTLNGHEGPISRVVFSNDDKRIASASQDGTVKIWHAITGEEIMTLKGHTDGVHSVTFSPDGRRIASASADQTVKLWDAITGQETITLKGHGLRVLDVAFSPDGWTIASSSADGSIMLWDGRPLMP